MQKNQKRYTEYEKIEQDRKILSYLRIISNTVRKTADLRLGEKCSDLSEMSACFILYLDKQEEDGKPVFHKDQEKNKRLFLSF